MLACRTCLTNKDLSPLFGDRSAVKFDSIQLFQATGIQIKDSDGLPQVACKSCLRAIRKVLNFKEICKKSDEILRNINKNFTAESFQTRCIYNDMINGTESENPLFKGLDNDNDGPHNPVNDNDDSTYIKSENNIANNEQNIMHFEVDSEVVITASSDNVYEVPISNEGMIPFIKAETKPFNTTDSVKTETVSTRYINNERKIKLETHQDINRANNSKIERDKIDIKRKTKLVTNIDFDMLEGPQNNLTIDDLESSDSEPEYTIEVDLNLDDISGDETANFKTEAKKTVVTKKLSALTRPLRHFSQNAELGPSTIFGQHKFRNTNKTQEKRFGKLKATSQLNNFNQFKVNNEPYMALAVAHSKATNGKAPLQCKKCHKVLVDRQSFITHAKLHFEPEFICEVCGKMFRSRNHMGYHQQRRHGRLKRLACTRCEFRAVDRITLMNHVRLEHTGERPYICEECGATFRMRRAIVQHMRRHFAVRNIQCDRCPAMFKTRSEVWSHRNKAHLMYYTYPCYLCTETYRGREAVRRHLLNVHGLPPEQQMKVACVKVKK